MNAPEQAAIPNRRCVRRLLDCIHTSKCTTPKARQIPAIADHMTVIQLIRILGVAVGVMEAGLSFAIPALVSFLSYS